jgi:hypothetical protein
VSSFDGSGISGTDDSVATMTPKRKSSMNITASRGRRDMTSRVRDAIIALATCHNVSWSSSTAIAAKSATGNTGHER